MNSDRFVIVGASIGGMTAAEELRKLTDAEIVLIDGDPDAPYDKTALSKAALLDETVPDIGMRSAEEFDARKITVLAGRWATALDAAAHELMLDDGERLHYSKLLIAAGAFPMVPFPVSDGANVHVLRTLDDARGLHAAFRDGTPHVTVIGSGLIGCEVASAARNLGLPTLLISVDTGPFSIVLGSDAADFIADAQDSAGLDMRYNAQVKGITLDEATGKTRIELGEGDALVTDIILAGTGVRPSTAWLESSGMRFDRGILCAEDLQTSLPDVYAIGDIARWPGGPFGELVRLEHWTNASDQGAHIAHVLATGSPARGADLPLPFFSSQLHGNRVASIGFPAQAEQTAAFRDDGRMLVLYGKNEQLIGALVVNNTALLARFTPLVQERISWQDALAAAAAVAPVGVTA